MTRHHITALILVAVTACSERPADKLLVFGVGDTIAVYASSPQGLPVKAVDAAGRALDAKRLRFERLTPAASRITDDVQITCVKREDISVRVSAAPISKQVVVRCQPIRGLINSPPIQLDARGGSHELAVTALGTDNEVISELAGRITVADTLVAVVRDGRIEPRAPGETAVNVEVGDCAMSVAVEVLENVPNSEALGAHQQFLTPLRLVSGEMRSFRLRPGRYDVRIAPDERRAQPVFSPSDMNCARFPDGGHYSCVAGTNAAAVMSHPRRGGEAVATLAIRRLDAPRQTARQASFNTRNTDRPREAACPIILR